MKNSTFDVALLILASGFSCLVFALMCGFLVQSAKVTQAALNKQCETNYSVMDVMFSGEQLTELCRIGQQQIHLNQ
jgi:hypothetical protein